jgi:hypothetical protein
LASIFSIENYEGSYANFNPMNEKRKFVNYTLWLLLILLLVVALKHVEENDFRLLFGCVLGGVCLYVATKPKNEGNGDTSNPTNDNRNQNSRVFSRVLIWCCVIFFSSFIGAIFRIFTTPLYTGGNDIGVAGLGNLLYHPITHGPKGAIEGAIIGVFAIGLMSFLRNRKESKLPPIIQNERD